MRIDCALSPEREHKMSEHSPTGPKRATNLSVNVTLLNAARERKINLSATLEAALIEEMRTQDAAAWLAENERAINEYAEYVQSRGVFGDDLRRF